MTDSDDRLERLKKHLESTRRSQEATAENIAASRRAAKEYAGESRRLRTQLSRQMAALASAAANLEQKRADYYQQHWPREAEIDEALRQMKLQLSRGKQ